MTEVKWTGYVVEDFRDLNKEVQRKIVEKVEKLEEEGTNIEEVGKASRKDMNIEVWRLKVKEEDIDHRVIFDIVDDKILLIAAGHRDDIYETESWNEISNRISKS